MTEAEQLENLMSRLPASKVAIGLGITIDQLHHRVRSLGLSPKELKAERDKNLIKSYHKKLTIAEMMQDSGFSRAKVFGLMRKHNVLSKFSNKVEVKA